MLLDAFNRHAEKVSIATCAQLVNNINALFLFHEDPFFATPNFHIFDMYAAHLGGHFLRAEFSAPEVHYQRDDKPATFWGLGSASRKGNIVTLTAVNPDLAKPCDTRIALRGVTMKRDSGTVLAAGDMHAHNTFDHPDNVKIATLNATLSGELLNVSIPAASVIKLEITLG